MIICQHIWGEDTRGAYCTQCIIGRDHLQAVVGAIVDTVLLLSLEHGATNDAGAELRLHAGAAKVKDVRAEILRLCQARLADKISESDWKTRNDSLNVRLAIAQADLGKIEERIGVTRARLYGTFVPADDCLYSEGWYVCALFHRAALTFSWLGSKKIDLGIEEALAAGRIRRYQLARKHFFAPSVLDGPRAHRLLQTVRKAGFVGPLDDVQGFRIEQETP